jgi:hypothetical protein
VKKATKWMLLSAIVAPTLWSVATLIELLLSDLRGGDLINLLADPIFGLILWGILILPYWLLQKISEIKNQNFISEKLIFWGSLFVILISHGFYYLIYQYLDKCCQDEQLFCCIGVLFYLIILLTFQGIGIAITYLLYRLTRPKSAGI